MKPAKWNKETRLCRLYHSRS